MSNALFPVLAGETFDGLKVPQLNTIVHQSVNLSELRASLSDAPVYTYTLKYDVLRDDVIHNELKTLMGFFLARKGSYDSFLYADPDDGAVTAQPFGVGDGATTKFMLGRGYGDGYERVANLANAPLIYANAVLQTSGYTIDAYGVVTFTPAPAANVPLTWTGTYLYRCRFLHDVSEFNQFMYKLWEHKSVQFLACLGTKL